MKKIIPSTVKNKTTNKNINLSKILNSDYFFQSSNLLKMALNKNRILSKDFGIRRAKAKIDIGKKYSKNLSTNSLKKEGKEEEGNDNNTNTLLKKKQIPFELADILDNNRTKFKQMYEAFHDIKEQNEAFISYFHYMKKSNARSKIKHMKLSYDKAKKDDYINSLQKYNFSTRDKIELELQKKLAFNIFKSNPLMINNNNDMLFYFLNTSQDKQINIREQNHAKFLTKVKELLDYMKTIIEYKDDKDLKVQNSKYMMKYKKKIEEENLKLKEEQHKQCIIDTLESKKMIKQTKRSMKILSKNKSFFEDPLYFSNENNFLSSTYSNINDKNNGKLFIHNINNIMSKSTKNFFSNEKPFFNKKNNTIDFLQKKKIFYLKDYFHF